MSEGFDGVKASVDAANESLDAMAGLLGRIADKLAPIPPQVDEVKKKADELKAAVKKNAESSREAFVDAMGLDGVTAAYGKFGQAVDLAFGKNNTFLGRMLAGGAIVGQFASHVLASGEALAQAAMRGEDQAEALARLGSAYHLVQAATNDTVSAQQALRVQQQLVQSGLRVSGEELAAVTRVAREYAQANQMDVGQALAQVTDALRTGSKEGLQRYGIELVQSRDRADGFHRTLGRVQERLRGTTPEARSLGEEHERLSRSIGEAVDRFALAIARLIRLKEVMEAAGAAASEMADAVNGEGPGATTEQSGRTSQQQEVSRTLLNSASALASARFGVDAQSAIRSGRVSTGDQQRLAEELFNAQSAEQAQAAIDRATGAREARIAQDASNERVARTVEHQTAGRGGYGGGGAANDNAEFHDFDSEKAKGLAEVYAAEAVAFAESVRSKQEQYAAILATEKNYYRQLAELKDAAAKQELVAAQAKETAGKAEVEADRQRSSMKVQFTDATTKAFRMQETTAQAAAGVFTSVVGTMQSSFQSHLQAVILGRESIGDALKGIAQDTLVALASEAAVQAIMETAKGIAKLAGSYGTDGTAAGHFAAAGMYAAVATAAGVGAYALSQSGGGGGQQAAGAANSNAGPTRAGEPAGAGSQGGNVTYVVNVNGTVMDREGTANALVGLLDDASMRGRVPRATRQAATRRAA